MSTVSSSLDAARAQAMYAVEAHAGGDRRRTLEHIATAIADLKAARRSLRETAPDALERATGDTRR